MNSPQYCNMASSRGGNSEVLLLEDGSVVTWKDNPVVLDGFTILKFVMGSQSGVGSVVTWGQSRGS